MTWMNRIRHIWRRAWTTLALAGVAAPVMAGDPGYRAGLDRDGDGVGCE